jgi:transcriptional regulator with XRE-family HTH domain
MSKNGEIDPVNEALRSRLAVVLKQHSQAEVARRTGHSLSNVNRYATGTRMPASFVCALVTELGVNPTWLLKGEGEPNSADISDKAEGRATDLLEIVKAMSAVTQMRLGSLTTRHHLKVLKELNESFNRYETLQKRLNEHSRELFKQMMEDLASALDNMDLDRAERLRESALQVSKLCDDFDLNYDFFQYQARIEFGKGRPEKAAELMRKQFLFSMMRTGKLEPRDLDNIMRFSISVASQHREREGVRIMRSGLAMLSAEQYKWPAVSYIEFLIGHFTVLGGDLRNGLAIMQRYFPAINIESRRTVCETYLVNAMLYAKVLDVDGAIHFGGASESKGKWIMDFAVVMEDVPAIEAAVAYYDSPQIVPVKGQSDRTRAHRIVLKALKGQTKEAFADWEEFTKGLKKEDVIQLHARVVHGQILRAAHKWKKALEDAIETERLLNALDTELTVGQMFESRHYRGILALSDQGEAVPPELLKKSKAYFQRMHQGGYTAFEKWA